MRSRPDTVRRKSRQSTCQICGKTFPLSQLVRADFIRSSVADTIKDKHGKWDRDGYVCVKDLSESRMSYVQHILAKEKGELNNIQEDVLDSLRQNDLLSRDVNIEYERGLTFGQRLADHIADFGGSWRFIILFGVVIVVWMSINSLALFRKPFDPYPFILLNLVLSTLAAIQAPVIMMSQNRQEARDRLRAENDYRVNLKSELEVRLLTEKMDHLIEHQWQRLLEIQEIQLEAMEQSKPSEAGKGGGTPKTTEKKSSGE